MSLYSRCHWTHRTTAGPGLSRRRRGTRGWGSTGRTSRWTRVAFPQCRRDPAQARRWPRPPGPAPTPAAADSGSCCHCQEEVPHAGTLRQNEWSMQTMELDIDASRDAHHRPDRTRWSSSALPPRRRPGQCFAPHATAGVALMEWDRVPNPTWPSRNRAACHATTATATGTVRRATAPTISCRSWLAPPCRSPSSAGASTRDLAVRRPGRLQRRQPPPAGAVELRAVARTLRRQRRAQHCATEPRVGTGTTRVESAR